MSEPLYYYLADVEAMFACSRDTINRLCRYGVLRADGKNKQRRILGTTARALAARIEAGEALWDILHAAAASAASPTGAAVSTSMPAAKRGASSRRKQTARASRAATSDTTKPPPGWLKRIG